MSKFLDARFRIREFIVANCSDVEAEMSLHSDLSIMTTEMARVIADKEAEIEMLRKGITIYQQQI